MQPLNKAQTSGPPVRRLMKAYWLYWRGDLREAKILAEAMIERDRTDRVAQSLLTKIAAKQNHPDSLDNWEPSSVTMKVAIGFQALLALFVTSRCIRETSLRGLTAWVVQQSKSGTPVHYPLWLVLIFCLLWSWGSVWYFVKLLLNRK